VAQAILMSGVERRRSWSEEDRRRILAEAFAPGAVAAAVARRYEVSSGLLYTWRRQARQRGAEPSFVRALVSNETSGALAARPACDTAIVIELPSGVCVKIAVSASEEIIVATLKALRA
jgi:transposase